MSVSPSSILVHRGDAAALGESSQRSRLCRSRLSASKLQRLLTALFWSGSNEGGKLGGDTVRNPARGTAENKC